MLFEHHDIHAHAGEKKSQHHAGGAASNDAAARTQDFAHSGLL
jgi:hypothetical protein